MILQSGCQRKEAHKFYENLGFYGNKKKAFDLRLGKQGLSPIFNLTKTRYTEFPYEKRIR